MAYSMTGPVAQVIDVLDHIVTLLTDPVSGCAVSPLPCRFGVETGTTVAWDTCGEGDCADTDGQLWASLTALTVVGANSGPECVTVQWTAQVGVVRCAAPMGEDGSAPSTTLTRADVDQQAADADAIRYALSCCESRGDALRDVALVSWIPLGPAGGCVGGQWTVRGVLDVCC